MSKGIRCVVCHEDAVMETTSGLFVCTVCKGSKEQVNHPSHYNPGTYEVIKVIEAHDLNFCLGNAVKYILRAEHKGSRKTDLEKAIWYLKRELENG